MSITDSLKDRVTPKLFIEGASVTFTSKITVLPGVLEKSEMLPGSMLTTVEL
jgi:hypothetical protein